MLEGLREPSARLVGLKQVLRALEEGQAQEVYIALDADNAIQCQVTQMCADKNVTVHRVDSMKKLGQACGIDVSAATAAKLK